MANPQDIDDRRAYIVRAREELLTRLSGEGDDELTEVLTRPYVVMTEELPFEQYIEGWRLNILRVSKLTFLRETMELYGLIRPEAEALLGSWDSSEEFFDRWWVAEEAEITELETRAWRT